jgi:hemerythrin superfamily protein
MPLMNTSITDAIELLTTDHEHLRSLLAELGDTTTDQAEKRTQLLRDIAHRVRIHARIEEEIFYPAFRAAALTKEDAKLFYEANEEHNVVDGVLPGLESENPETDIFSAKVKVLTDLLEHHAEEEEDLMFPRALKLLGKDRLIQLGAQMDARRKELELR